MRSGPIMSVIMAGIRFIALLSLHFSVMTNPSVLMYLFLSEDRRKQYMGAVVCYMEGATAACFFLLEIMVPLWRAESVFPKGEQIP